MREPRPEIPPLRDLVVSPNGYQMPSGFAEGFVVLHLRDWRDAEKCWERVIERVLETDAVEVHATGVKAINQAVRAAGQLLVDGELPLWCPICRRRGTALSGSPLIEDGEP